MEKKFKRVASSKASNDIADYLLYYRHTKVNDEISCLDEITSGYIEVLMDELQNKNWLSDRVERRYNIYSIEKEIKFKDTDMQAVLDNLISLLGKTKYDAIINPKSILYLKSDIIFEIGFHTFLQTINYADRCLPKHSKDIIIPNNFSINDYRNNINDLYNEYQSHFKSIDKHGIEKLEVIYKTSISKLTDEIIKTTGKGRFVKNVIDKDKILEYEQARDIDLLKKKILDLIEYIDNMILRQPEPLNVGVYNSSNFNQMNNDTNWTEEERNLKGPYADQQSRNSLSLSKPQTTQEVSGLLLSPSSGNTKNLNTATSTSVQMNNATQPRATTMTTSSSNQMQNIISASGGSTNQNHQRSVTTSSSVNKASNHPDMNVYDTTKHFKDKYEDRDPLNDIIHRTTTTVPITSSPMQVRVSRQHMLVNDRTHPRYRSFHQSRVIRDDMDDNDPFLSGHDDDEIDEEDEDGLPNRAIESLKALKRTDLTRTIPNLNDSSPTRSKLTGKKRSITQFGNRSKVPWTEDEENTLTDAVIKFQRDWAKIRDDPVFGPVFKVNNRTNVDLKDKWRNMAKVVIKRQSLGEEI